MVKQLGLLLVTRAETILDQLKVSHLTEEQIRSIRDPLYSSGNYVCRCHTGAAKKAQRKRRSKNGKAKTAQRKQRSENGAVKTAQRKRHRNNGAETTAPRTKRSSNNGAATTAQQQRRSNNGAATTAQQQRRHITLKRFSWNSACHV